MNKRKSMILRVAAFIPALFMMYIIFGFSGDTGEESSSLSATLAEAVVHTLEQIVPDWIPEGGERIEFTDLVHNVIRKLAHMAEYAVLALTLLFALWVNDVREKRRLLLTLIISLGYACTDELHQLFVPGRSGKFADVCVDMFGVGCMLLVVILIGRWSSRKNSQ